jgi:predicted neuraminidase
MFQERFVSTPVLNAPCQHASSLVALQNGDLVCAWFVATMEKNADQAIFFSRLGRGEAAWKPMTRLLESERALGNPVLYQHTDGCLWLIYVEMVLPRDWEKCRLHAMYSDDGGTTWSDRRTLVEFLGYMPRNHPLLLRDGSVILPLYDEHKGRSVFLISRDDGETWELGGDIISDPGNEQAALVQVHDGSLLAFMRTRDAPGRIWQSSSRNSGWDWSPPVQTAFPNCDAGIDVVRLPNGHLVLGFNDSGLERTPLSVALSTDEGVSWCAVAHLETGPQDFDYPSFAIDHAGLVQVTYSYRPEHRIKHVAFDEGWIRANAVRDHA